MRRGRAGLAALATGLLCVVAACGTDPARTGPAPETAPDTSAAPTSPPTPTSPSAPTSPQAPTSGPTSPSEISPSVPSTVSMGQPSLTGDTRNAWAFAPLAAPEQVVVEGEAPRQRAWSTSKVLVLAAFLDGIGGNPDRMTSDQRVATIRSLTESDLDSLRVVRAAIPGGAPGAMQRILREIGDTTTITPPQLEGTMVWSVREQVRFMAALHAGEVVTPEASRFILDHMRPIGSQQWGLSGIGATAVKGGWLRADTETRQMGIVDGYAVAVVTDGVGSAVRQDDGDSAHVQQMNDLADLLARRLAG